MDTRRHIDDLTPLEVCERVRQLDRSYRAIDSARDVLSREPGHRHYWALRRAQRRYEALRDAVRFD